MMKVLCSCEIYWSALIDEGFKIEHGLGTVIGSRCGLFPQAIDALTNKKINIENLVSARYSLNNAV